MSNITIDPLTYGILVGCTVMNSLLFVVNVLLAHHNNNVFNKLLRQLLQGD